MTPQTYNNDKHKEATKLAGLTYKETLEEVETSFKKKRTKAKGDKKSWYIQIHIFACTHVKKERGRERMWRKREEPRWENEELEMGNEEGK